MIPLFVILLGDGGKNPILFTLAVGFLLGLTVWAFVIGREFRALRHPSAPAILLWLGWSVLSFLGNGCEPLSTWPLLKLAAAVSFAFLAIEHWGAAQQRFFQLFLLSLGIGVTFLAMGARFTGGAPGAIVSGNPQYDAFILVAATLVTAVGASKHRSWGAMGILALLLLGVAFSHSRSATVSVALGLILLAVRRWGRRGVLAALALVALILVALTPTVMSQWAKAHDPLAWKRADIWRGAIQAALDRPLLGWGPGRFDLADQARRLPREDMPVRYGISTAFAHNDFLQTAVEAGFPAMTFVLFAVGFYFWGRWRDESIENLPAVAGALAFAFVNFPLTAPLCAMILAGLAGEDAPSPRLSWGVNTATGERLRKMAIGGLAVTVLFAVVCAAFLIFRPRGVWGDGAVPNPLAPEGLLARAKGNPTSGLADFQRALWWDPRSARAWRGLANANAAVMALNPAEIQIQRALSLHPTQAVWWLDAAEIHRRQGNLEAARNDCHRALALEPQFGAAALALGRILRWQGENVVSARWLDGWIRRPSAPAEPPGTYAHTILHRDIDEFRNSHVQ